MTSTPRRIFLLGATGGIGRAVTAQGLARGHRITAFVRSPEKLGVLPEGLTAVKGDPRDAEQLRRALPGHDAVISALGPPGIGPTTIHEDCARSTLEAMRTARVKRLLIVSAAVNFFGQGPIVWLFRKTFLRHVHADTMAMERLVMESDLDWTIARPPSLNNAALTGRYLAEDARLPKGPWSMTRADVACFLLDALERDAFVRQRVGLVAAKAPMDMRVPERHAAAPEAGAWRSS